MSIEQLALWFDCPVELIEASEQYFRGMMRTCMADVEAFSAYITGGAAELNDGL